MHKHLIVVVLNFSEGSPATKALNIFKAFVAGVDSVNIRMTTIPCVCFHCIQGNPWLFIKNIKEIRTVRQESMRYLTENVHVDELEDKYEMK